jgi:hypothetical protein
MALGQFLQQCDSVVIGETNSFKIQRERFFLSEGFVSESTQFIDPRTD